MSEVGVRPEPLLEARERRKLGFGGGKQDLEGKIEGEEDMRLREEEGKAGMARSRSWRKGREAWRRRGIADRTHSLYKIGRAHV